MFLPVGIKLRQLMWPTATIALIVCNVLMYAAQQFLAPGFVYQLMLRPDRLDPIAWITSMFLHADVSHLLFNMVFLWTFGMFVECRLGWQRTLLLYFAAGFGASTVFFVMHMGETTPALGASGAIAGLMGLSVAAAPLGRIYVLPVHPVVLALAATRTRRIRFLVPMVAWVGLWVFAQLMYASIGIEGIAFSAHFGGVGAGLLLGLAMRAAGGSPPDPEDLDAPRERMLTTVVAAWAGGSRPAPKVDYMSPRAPNFHDDHKAESPPVTVHQFLPDEPLDG